jgi:two-component sensor histidine kinase
MALARAHTLLSERRWSGAELRALLEGELSPFLSAVPPVGDAIEAPHDTPRAELDGPPVTLAPAAAQPLSMALHELATNATKHGALSAPDGRVSVFWETDDRAGVLRLLWAEAGGPPVAAPPTRRGFGSRMLEATLRDQLGGRVSREWRPGGLVCGVELPLARAVAGQSPPPTIRTGLEPDAAPGGAGLPPPGNAHPPARPRGAVLEAVAAAPGGAPVPAAPGGEAAAGPGR